METAKRALTGPHFGPKVANRVSWERNLPFNSNRASQVRFLGRKPGRRSSVDLFDLSSTTACQPEPVKAASFSTVRGPPCRAQEAGRQASFPTRTSSASLLRGSLAAFSPRESLVSRLSVSDSGALVHQSSPSLSGPGTTYRVSG